jgi:hypothetical protein
MFNHRKTMYSKARKRSNLAMLAPTMEIMAEKDNYHTIIACAHMHNSVYGGNETIT